LGWDNGALPGEILGPLMGLVWGQFSSSNALKKLKNRGILLLFLTMCDKVKNEKVQ
jgi:hypothetical protein